MRLLHLISRMLGPFGLAAAGVSVLCAAFFLAAVKPAETEFKAQQQAARNLKSRTAYQPVSLDRRSDDLRRFHAQFAPVDQIAVETQKLWKIASQYKIDLQQGEYRLESGGAGLARYRITLPLRASYGQIRQLVGYILKEIPAMSIDGLRFERKKISDAQLDAQIKLTLYLRPADLAMTVSGTPPSTQ